MVRFMKIVIACDSFKGSATAIDAAKCIAQGIRKVYPDAQAMEIPIADGGEGTVQAFLCATPGNFVETVAADPLGRRINTGFAILDDGTAVIESAAASGLTLLKKDELDPMHTTTYGTGELIRAALDAGCRKMIIGIGGSATNDAGAGMAQALGASFKDKYGSELSFGGAELGNLEHIDLSGMDTKYRKRK